MHSGLGELIDEVTEVRKIEVHVLVDIGQTDRTSCGRRRRWRIRTAEYMSKCDKEMLKQSATETCVSTSRSNRRPKTYY